MLLDNTFLPEDRHIYLGIWYCWGIKDDGTYCGSNGSDCGGLELHHILGRKKYDKTLSSILNSALLCKRCHDMVTHSLDEHRGLFLKTLQFLQGQHYQLKQNDIDFMNAHQQELIGQDVKLWLIS